MLLGIFELFMSKIAQISLKWALFNAARASRNIFRPKTKTLDTPLQTTLQKFIFCAGFSTHHKLQLSLECFATAAARKEGRKAGCFEEGARERSLSLAHTVKKRPKEGRLLDCSLRRPLLS